MRRKTFKVLYFISRTKIQKDGRVPIYARISLNKERAEFATGRFVDPKLWNADAGKIKSSEKEAKEINSYLVLIKANLLLKKREMEEQGREVTALDLKNVYLGIDSSDKTILQVFKEHNDRAEGLVNKDFAPGTIERYQTCYKHLKGFIKEKYKKADCRLAEVNPMFVTGFEYYLKTTRNCCNNTAVKYIKNFKKIVRIALANGWLKNDPFIGIKFRLDDVDLAYLDAKELDKLMKKHFAIDRMQQVKDVYLFCCFTGLAFVDVSTLNSEDIVDVDGAKWIKKRRQKTKNWCHVPLLEPAKAILDKYKDHTGCLKKGRLLPVLTNQKMNAYLKEIADITGIEKHLSTHTARHTFATTVTLSNSISMEVVSKMLGHSSVNMTKKYARVVDDFIGKDMQKLVGKYEPVTASEKAEPKSKSNVVHFNFSPSAN
jgi:site-specific recombinase XerD